MGASLAVAVARDKGACKPIPREAGTPLTYACAVAIRVVLGEDNYIVREGLRQLLAAAGGIELVAECADFDSMVREVDAQRPDVVLTDIRMPPTQTDEGIRIAAQLRAEHPEVGVVVLSQYAEPGYVLELLDAGSEGRAYLLKERVHDRRQLALAIEAVAAGDSVIDPKIVELLVDARTRGKTSPLAQLTTRELEVLAAIAEGKSNTAISEALVLTKRAVEKHINAIFLKLNLTHAEDAAAVSPRVKAALLFLAEPDAGARGREHHLAG
jgi:DNA-binding NarL/FixJ family response regulator